MVIPEGVKEIEERAFTYSKFAEIKLPDTLKIIGNYAFENCSKLKSVYIPKSVNYIGNNIFHGCSVLEHIEVDNDNTVYDSRKSCNAIIETSRDKMIAACTNTLITDDVVDIAMVYLLDSVFLQIHIIRQIRLIRIVLNIIR